MEPSERDYRSGRCAWRVKTLRACGSRDIRRDHGGPHSRHDVSCGEAPVERDGDGEVCSAHEPLGGRPQRDERRSAEAVGHVGAFASRQRGVALQGSCDVTRRGGFRGRTWVGAVAWSRMESSLGGAIWDAVIVPFHVKHACPHVEVSTPPPPGRERAGTGERGWRETGSARNNLERAAGASPGVLRRQVGMLLGPRSFHVKRGQKPRRGEATDDIGVDQRTRSRSTARAEHVEWTLLSPQGSPKFRSEFESSARSADPARTSRPHAGYKAKVPVHKR